MKKWRNSKWGLVAIATTRLSLAAVHMSELVGLVLVKCA
jgi:hypothetical protein